MDSKTYKLIEKALKLVKKAESAAEWQPAIHLAKAREELNETIMFRSQLTPLIISNLSKGMPPEDAMCEAQKNTQKRYTRDELRDATNAAIEHIENSGKKFEWMDCK